MRGHSSETPVQFAAGNFARVAAGKGGIAQGFPGPPLTTLRCVWCRFGGEGGGITVLVNKASFLSPVPPVGAKTLPNGTQFSGLPQGSTIILERCEIDSCEPVAQSNSPFLLLPLIVVTLLALSTADGSARGVQPERRSNIWLEQIPSVLIVRDSLGFAYAPSFGPPANMSMVKVDPLLDLNGPQLAYAAELDNLLTFDIANTNNWFPTKYADLPEQLRPWVVGKVRMFVLLLLRSAISQLESVHCNRDVILAMSRPGIRRRSAEIWALETEPIRDGTACRRHSSAAAAGCDGLALCCLGGTRLLGAH